MGRWRRIEGRGERGDWGGVWECQGGVWGSGGEVILVDSRGEEEGGKGGRGLVNRGMMKDGPY